MVLDLLVTGPWPWVSSIRLLHRNWDWRSLEAVGGCGCDWFINLGKCSSKLKLHAQAWGRWSALGCNGLNHLSRNPQELSSWMCYVSVSVGVKLSLKVRWWNSGKRNSSSEPQAELVVTSKACSNRTYEKPLVWWNRQTSRFCRDPSKLQHRLSNIAMVSKAHVCNWSSRVSMPAKQHSIIIINTQAWSLLTKAPKSHKLITANDCHKCYSSLLTPNCTWASWPHFPTTSSRIIPHTQETKIPNNKNPSFIPSKSTPHPATDPIQTLTSNPTNIWDNWSLHLCLSFVHHHQHLSLTLYNLPQEPHTLYNQTSQKKPLH